ncbi:hypothetical protein BKA70DRAFT_1538835 [Coprinopsis sp. MPI-PUGE-AT-0042]|nr:hypothetical protein BKA70DRAFT_1538835 [Coprinopsis sp. MPI-PUGE-AT-0042]
MVEEDWDHWGMTTRLEVGDVMACVWDAGFDVVALYLNGSSKPDILKDLDAIKALCKPPTGTPGGSALQSLTVPIPSWNAFLARIGRSPRNLTHHHPHLRHLTLRSWRPNEDAAHLTFSHYNLSQLTLHNLRWDATHASRHSVREDTQSLASFIQRSRGGANTKSEDGVTLSVEGLAHLKFLSTLLISSPVIVKLIIIERGFAYPVAMYGGSRYILSLPASIEEVHFGEACSEAEFEQWGEELEVDLNRSELGKSAASVLVKSVWAHEMAFINLACCSGEPTRSD